MSPRSDRAIAPRRSRRAAGDDRIVTTRSRVVDRQPRVARLVAVGQCDQRDIAQVPRDDVAAVVTKGDLHSNGTLDGKRQRLVFDAHVETVVGDANGRIERLESQQRIAGIGVGKLTQLGRDLLVIGDHHLVNALGAQFQRADERIFGAKEPLGRIDGSVV